MKVICLATLLAAISQAVVLQKIDAAPQQLSQTETTGDWEDPDCDWDKDCHCDEWGCESQYRCPPALERCPGVLQPPGACKTVLDRAPLCYCNNGFMHTDWDHNISVDDKPCKNCGRGRCRDSLAAEDDQ